MPLFYRQADQSRASCGGLGRQSENDTGVQEVPSIAILTVSKNLNEEALPFDGLKRVCSGELHFGMSHWPPRAIIDHKCLYNAGVDAMSICRRNPGRRSLVDVIIVVNIIAQNLDKKANQLASLARPSLALRALPIRPSSCGRGS